MDKKIAGLLGAVAALATVNAAQAAPAPATEPADVLQANSYADLLQPIPNAVARLRAMDESSAPRAEGTIQLAQAHHHHHHHHAHARRPVVVIGRHRHHHHHHHHHHDHH